MLFVTPKVGAHMPVNQGSSQIHQVSEFPGLCISSYYILDGCIKQRSSSTEYGCSPQQICSVVVLDPRIGICRRREGNEHNKIEYSKHTPAPVRPAAAAAGESDNDR
jgi:hypothetical protein